jgi:hypothetical protein
LQSGSADPNDAFIATKGTHHNVEAKNVIVFFFFFFLFLFLSGVNEYMLHLIENDVAITFYKAEGEDATYKK